MLINLRYTGGGYYKGNYDDNVISCMFTAISAECLEHDNLKHLLWVYIKWQMGFSLCVKRINIFLRFPHAMFT